MKQMRKSFRQNKPNCRNLGKVFLRISNTPFLLAYLDQEAVSVRSEVRKRQRSPFQPLRSSEKETRFLCFLGSSGARRKCSWNLKHQQMCPDQMLQWCVFSSFMEQPLQPVPCRIPPSCLPCWLSGGWARGGERGSWAQARAHPWCRWLRALATDIHCSRLIGEPLPWVGRRDLS